MLSAWLHRVFSALVFLSGVPQCGKVWLKEMIQSQPDTIPFWNAELFLLLWNQSTKKCFIQLSPLIFMVRICSWLILSSPRHCNLCIEVHGWMQLTQIMHQTELYFTALKMSLSEMLRFTLLSMGSGRWRWKPPEGVLIHLSLSTS